MTFDVISNTKLCKEVTEKLLPFVKKGISKALKDKSGYLKDCMDTSSVDMEFVNYLADLKHLEV